MENKEDIQKGAMTEKKADCSKCKERAVHSILVRLGKNPSPLDPKAGEKDKTRLIVYRYCDQHWREIKEYFPGL